MRNLFILGAVLGAVTLTACDDVGKISVPKPAVYKPKPFKFTPPKTPDIDWDQIFKDLDAARVSVNDVEGIDLGKYNAMALSETAFCLKKEEEMDTSMISQQQTIEAKMNIFKQDVIYLNCDAKEIKGGVQTLHPSFEVIKLAAPQSFDEDVIAVLVKNARTCSELRLEATPEISRSEVLNFEGKNIKFLAKNRSSANMAGEVELSMNDYIVTLDSSLGINSGTNIVDVSYLGVGDKVLAQQKFNLQVVKTNIEITGQRRADVCIK